MIALTLSYITKWLNNCDGF